MVATTWFALEEPGGSVMNYTYDGSHKITAKTDSRGFTTQYLYGPNGNLVEARQANSGHGNSFPGARKLRYRPLPPRVVQSIIRSRYPHRKPWKTFISVAPVTPRVS